MNVPIFIQQIQRIGYNNPWCKDCIHFVSKSNAVFNYCKKFKTEPILARLDESKCGIYAKWFNYNRK